MEITGWSMDDFWPTNNHQPKLLVIPKSKIWMSNSSKRLKFVNSSLKSSLGEVKIPLVTDQISCEFIVDFVDYSEKYGVGYKLSSGKYGVLFNDDTSFVLDPISKLLTYVWQENQEEVTV